MALNLRAERSYLSLIQLLIAHQSPNLCRHHSESFIILISLVAEGTKAKESMGSKMNHWSNST